MKRIKTFNEMLDLESPMLKQITTKDLGDFISEGKTVCIVTTELKFVDFEFVAPEIPEYTPTEFLKYYEEGKIDVVVLISMDGFPSIPQTLLDKSMLAIVKPEFNQEILNKLNVVSMPIKKN